MQRTVQPNKPQENVELGGPIWGAHGSPLSCCVTFEKKGMFSGHINFFPPSNIYGGHINFSPSKRAAYITLKVYKEYKVYIDVKESVTFEYENTEETNLKEEVIYAVDELSKVDIAGHMGVVAGSKVMYMSSKGVNDYSHKNNEYPVCEEDVEFMTRIFSRIRSCMLI